MEIAKITQALEKELKNAFPEQNGVVNPLIASINAFVKGYNNAVMPDGILGEANKQAVVGLKEKYQARLTDINKPDNKFKPKNINPYNQSNKQI